MVKEKRRSSAASRGRANPPAAETNVEHVPPTVANGLPSPDQEAVAGKPATDTQGGDPATTSPGPGDVPPLVAGQAPSESSGEPLVAAPRNALPDRDQQAIADQRTTDTERNAVPRTGQPAAPQTANDSAPWEARIDAKGYHCIESVDGGFGVWLDKDGQLQYETTDAFDADYKGSLHDWGGILIRISWLSAKLYRDDIPLNFQRPYVKMMGLSLARAFSKDFANAQQHLTNVETLLQNKFQEMAREWYLKASFGWAAVPIAIALWLQLWKPAWIVGRPLELMLLAAGAGASGALLSVIQRIGKVPVDPFAGKSVHRVEALGRITVGAIAGVLFSLLAQSGQILPIAVGNLAENGSTEKLSALLAACIIGGASERLVQSIITKAEGSQTDESKGDRKKGVPETAPKDSTAQALG